MLNIKILGPGCRNCYLVEQMAAAGLVELLDENHDLKATLEHIEDLLEIEQYPTIITPALVLNEKVVCSGRVPNKQEVISWLREAVRQL